MARTELFSRKQAGGAFTIAGVDRHPGNIYFVHSGTGTNAAGYGLNPDAPLASVAYAFSSDLVVSGDVVYVLPGHAETISAAGSITADIAGVQVIGLGVGNARPTFTWSATDATIAVSAASVVFKNIRCTCSIDEVVSMWNWTGAAGTMDAVDYFETTSCQAIQFLTASAASTDFTVQNCRHQQATAAASNSQWIEFIGARSVIQNNIFVLTQTSNSASKVLSNGTAAVGLVISNNRIAQISASGIAISIHASSTGIANDNRVTSTGTLAGKIALGGAMGLENYVATTANKNGILDPVVA